MDGAEATLDPGPSNMPICPVVSAFSELKQFSDYPRCIGPKCAWYADHGTCAVLSMAQAINAFPHNILDVLSLDSKRNIETILRGLAELFRDDDGGGASALLSLVWHYAEQARRMYQHREQ